MNDSFTEFLTEHKIESYFLVGAPGNSGDILIRKGLELYLKENGYRVTGEISSADNILIHGGGNIDASALQSQSATVTINGEGKASVNVVTTLNAVVNGGGSITYTGSPQVTQQVNGLGSVKSS